MNHTQAVQALEAEPLAYARETVAIVIPPEGEPRGLATIRASFPECVILRPYDRIKADGFELIVMLWMPDAENDDEVAWFCDGLYPKLLPAHGETAAGRIKWLV